MTTASHGPSLSARVRAMTLAGAIVLSGLVWPGTVTADGPADGPASVPDDSPGAFDVSVDSVAELSGLTAVVAGGGERVHLRAEPAHHADILAKLADGTAVELRIDRLDTVYDPDGITRWWPVSTDGVDGWISGFYLVAPDGAAVESSGVDVNSPDQFTLDGPGLTGRTAVIAGGGDGINLRAAAGHDADVLDVLPSGTVVELRIDREDTVYDADGVTRWWPVRVDGQAGWVSGHYLIDPDDVSTIDEPEPEPDVAGEELTDEPSDSAGQFTLDGEGLTGRTAVISGGGDGVNLRNAPDEDAGIIMTLADGTVVNLQVDQYDTVLDDDGVTRWWPVEVNGAAGWVSGFYLSDGDAAAAADTEDGGRAGTTFVAGSYVAVDSIENIGANVRADAAPTGRDVGSLREGDVVRVVEGPASFIKSEVGWYLITTGQVTGYVDGDLLVPAEAPERDAADEDDDAAPAAFAAGDYAAATTRSGVGVNVREGASRETTRVGYLPERGIVRVTAGPEMDDEGNDWYRVTDGELTGWVDGDLLEPSRPPEMEPDEPEDEPEPARTEPTGPTGSFITPVNGTITQGFGCSSLGYYVYDPDFGCAVHDGIDIAAPTNTPIVAADGGTVVFAGLCDCGLGYYVEIDHGNGIHTLYGHMAEQPYVATGQRVSQGDVIGPVGSSGTSTGPHVHFMVRVDGVAQDPANFLP